MRWHATVGGSGTPGQFVNYVALYGHFIPRLFFFVKLELVVVELVTSSGGRVFIIVLPLVVMVWVCFGTSLWMSSCCPRENIILMF